jgi:hypothetical protein
MTKVEGIKFNAAGDDSSGLSLKDILNMGSKVYTDTLKSQTDASNAQAAIQLEKLKIQQQQAAAAASNSSSTGIAAKIKAYALPIAVVGVMVIGGISAYFYFKKKKA